MTNTPLTPYIALDLQKLGNNINEMQEKADKAEVILRPHAKTHKSVSIARMQIKAGAKGLTVAKPDEAITFIKNGISPIMLCYPIISEEKICTLLTIADTHAAEILFVLDSLHGFTVLDKVTGQLNKTVKAYMEIDTGLHRCGLLPEDKTLIELARRITSSKHIEFAGITSHAGHSYSAKNREQAQSIAEDERKILLNVKNRLAALKIPTKEICIGSTPTLWTQENFEGLTEIKPGNYVFNDLTQKNIGVVSWDQLALTIVTTVVSVNDTYMIVDAGSKSLTSDIGAHGTQGTQGYGLAFKQNDDPDDHSGLTVEKLSEEHGWINHKGNPLPIGTTLTIYPNHACPVINLFDEIHIFENGNYTETWPVDARGCVQ